MSQSGGIKGNVRSLLIVLGDQLDPESVWLRDLDKSRDALWMAEVESEISGVPSHQWRITGFLAAMRHYRDDRRREGWRVSYRQLADTPNEEGEADNHAEALSADLKRLKPERAVLVRPGDLRVQASLVDVLSASGLPWSLEEDDSFYCSVDDFKRWRGERKTLLMETFYRSMRKRFDVLMEGDGSPVGGKWNLDSDNRKSFGKHGPRDLPPIPEHKPSETTLGVINMVNRRYSDHPGDASKCNLPVTPRQAEKALTAFIDQRLAGFGTHQDAMWTGESQLWHSTLSFAINLKLISPRRCVEAAIDAYRCGLAPLNSVEGFVRQILGWREFTRGIYFTEMPGYAALNALDAQAEVPSSYWTGETDMACVREAMQSVLSTGYAHHIQRLMVLGLFAQLAGVQPGRFHDWHMAMYVDAVDWVSLPNTLGMSQYGDGGIVGSKPYCASGRYIDRMSNYCKGCRFNPAEAVGDFACPVTTLYWDFLARHRDLFASNGRMKFQMTNLARKDDAELAAIRRQARKVRQAL